MNNITQKTAEYCEQIFNSIEFQNLFTGDFEIDKKIYEAVGGAVLQYVNTTKDFDTKTVYKIFDNIKANNGLTAYDKTHFETELFVKYFCPEISKGKTKEQIIDLISKNVFHDGVLTNSFNACHVDRVKSKGFDYTAGDPFENEFKEVSILDKTGWGQKGLYFTDPSPTTMVYCSLSPEKLYCGPLNYTNIDRKPNEPLKDFLIRKFNKKIEEKQFYLAEDFGKRYVDVPVRRLKDVTTLEQQANIKKAIDTLINVYGNEQAGIAFISRNNFYKLNKEERGECSLLSKYFDDYMKIHKKYRKNETEEEIFNCSVANCIDLLNDCNSGWGTCIEKGKVEPEMLSVATVPQSGLISLQKQKELVKRRDDTLSK